MTDAPPSPTADELLAAEFTPRRFVLRSLLPISVVALLLSTFLVGPFGFTAAVIGWWLLLRRLA